MHPPTQQNKVALASPLPAAPPRKQGDDTSASFVPPTPDESQRTTNTQSSQDQRILELERDLTSSQAEKGSYEARSQELEAEKAAAEKGAEMS